MTGFVCLFLYFTKRRSAWRTIQNTIDYNARYQQGAVAL